MIFNSFGFPDGSVVKYLPVKIGDTGLILGREDSLGMEVATTPVFFPGTVHGIAKESDTI